MPDFKARKAALRTEALSRRSTMGHEARVTASGRAASRLEPLIRAGEAVSLFWPMRDEIDPRELIASIEAVGGQVVMPVIEHRRMHFRLFDGPGSMEPGVFGTSHPRAGQPERDPDLIVAPLAAFDRRGGRIGYGGGYYDMFTAALKARGQAYRIAGIAFACQEVDAIPIEAHDEILPMIATESELIQVQPA